MKLLVLTLRILHSILAVVSFVSLMFAAPLHPRIPRSDGHELGGRVKQPVNDRETI